MRVIAVCNKWKLGLCFLSPESNNHNKSFYFLPPPMKMECVETGEYLWMVSNQHVFGFRVEKLFELGKNELRNWRSSLVPPPSDFCFKLPERDSRPFLFDSNLYFTSGSIHSSANIHQLSYVGGTTLDITEAVAIPRPPPTLLYEACNVENIQGEVYLMAPHKRHAEGEREIGFWVLRSGSKMWYPLCLPPCLLNNPGFDVHTHWWECFSWKDKLFLEADADPKGCPRKYIFYVYEPQSDDWCRLKHHFSYSEHDHHPLSIVPVSSLGDVGNCSVAMTWSLEEHYDFFRCRVEVKIHALLVDNQDYLSVANNALRWLLRPSSPPTFPF
ncbi:hypothetical protein PIB30_019682 [Stylosanthes scabra]|uniref:F-box protein n=1 Tax=Stylosanthes scabra TaxID=79078 RepID=A0ABU6T8P6_9FABA|nr:hypothetical protein [Stylosanthes scabra]